MRNRMCGAVIALILYCMSHSATAEDPGYRHGPGVWVFSAIHVDPGSLDSYVARLQKTERVYLEALKARGIIDDFRFVIRKGHTANQPNFIMQIHFTSFEMLSTNWEHNEELMKEVTAKVEKNGGRAIFPDFSRFREILDESYWVEVMP